MNLTTLLMFQNLRVSENRQRIIDCAAEIMNRYSEVQSSVVYENVWQLVDNILSNEMPNTTRIININKTFSNANNELEPYYMLTVICKHIDELAKYFESIYRILGWNSRAKHFIIYVGDEDLDRIFELSWKKYITRLLVLDKASNLYTYNPLKTGSCGRLLKIDYLFNCKDLDFKLIDNVFNSKGVMDYKGCIVNVLTSPLVPYVVDVFDQASPGFEIMALRELSQQINFTIKYVKNAFSNWGYKTVDNKYTGMYSLFFEGSADLMLGMLVANGTFLYDFDSSVAHTRSDLAFFVPSPNKLNSWENSIMVYSRSIWIAIFVSGVVMVVVWNYMGRKSFVMSALHVFGICCSKAVRQPQTGYSRYIFIIWTMFAMIITCSFESTLMSFLTKPRYEPDIQNINELVERNWKIGGFENAKELFSVNSNNRANDVIYKNWTNCNLDESCVNLTAQERNFATLTDVRQINYLSKYYVNSDGSRMIQQMPVIASFSMWVLFQKGFPIRDVTNKMIQRFIEGGLMEKWMADVSSEARAIEPIVNAGLSVEHIVFPFLIFGVGNLLALIVFITEYVYTRF